MSKIKKPLILKTLNEVIICFNGKKLIQPLDKYKELSEEEIVNLFLNSHK